MKRKGGYEGVQAKGSQARGAAPCDAHGSKGQKRGQGSRRSRSFVASRLCGNVDGPEWKDGRRRGGRRCGSSFGFKLCANVDPPQLVYAAVDNGTNGEAEAEGCRRCVNLAPSKVRRASAGHPRGDEECGERIGGHEDEDEGGGRRAECGRGDWRGWRSVGGNREPDARIRTHELHVTSFARGTMHGSTPTHGNIGRPLDHTGCVIHFTCGRSPHVLQSYTTSSCCTNGDGAPHERTATKPLHQPRSWTCVPDDGVGREEEEETADNLGPRDPMGRAVARRRDEGEGDGTESDNGTPGDRWRSRGEYEGDEGAGEGRWGERTGGIAPLRRAAPARPQRARGGSASWTEIGILMGAYFITVGIPLGLIYESHGERTCMTVHGGAGREAGGRKGGGRGKPKRRGIVTGAHPCSCRQAQVCDCGPRPCRAGAKRRGKCEAAAVADDDAGREAGLRNTGDLVG